MVVLGLCTKEFSWSDCRGESIQLATERSFKKLCGRMCGLDKHQTPKSCQNFNGMF